MYLIVASRLPLRERAIYERMSVAFKTAVVRNLVKGHSKKVENKVENDKQIALQKRSHALLTSICSCIHYKLWLAILFGYVFHFSFRLTLLRHLWLT